MKKKACMYLALSFVAIAIFGAINMATGQPLETKVGPKARGTLTEELAGVAETADARMKEGTATMADLLKVQIAVNFATHKLGELTEAELRERNDPLEKKLIGITRSLYALRDISTEQIIATVDFVVAHR